MIRHKMNQTRKPLGMIGLSGLGHISMKFGKALGPNVTSFQHKHLKEGRSLESTWSRRICSLIRHGANEDTASSEHPFDPYIATLKTTRVLILVGALSEIKLDPLRLLLGMITIFESTTSGTKYTQEMLGFLRHSQNLT
ncbi:unnamed protein product [Dovyalis caffra]|uniref:Uncharacterized protein n=1 Tax=Dovyalis caffra TaxID=77055 RepID=A0AAV1RQL5_9ROSI|nr:unnamed protein product [Dovyalis caffra]